MTGKGAPPVDRADVVGGSVDPVAPAVVVAAVEVEEVPDEVVDVVVGGAVVVVVELVGSVVVLVDEVGGVVVVAPEPHAPEPYSARALRVFPLIVTAFR